MACKKGGSGLNILGFNITRSSAGRMPMSNTIAPQPVPSGVLFPIDTTGIETIATNDRIIRNDPREAFFWSMPNKLTPQQCLQMLRAALAGDLFQQFNLCQLMLDTWPTFRMASHQLCEAAAYMRYAVHPCAEEGKKPTPKAIEKADLVSRAIRSMVPNPFNDEKGFSGMAYVLCDAMLNGLSLVELLWEQKASSEHGREWLPVSSAWVHPRHYTFSTAGYVALYNDDGNRISPTGNNSGKGINPDPDKFVCAQFISRAGSSLGAGFMRPLVWYWAARQFNNEWMLNTAKQYGSPFIDITYKAGTVSTGPNSELEKLNEMLKTAGAQRRLIHPEGTTAVIHQPSSLGKENPQRVLEEKADEACLFLLLGQKGTTTAVAGQLGNDDSHENVKEERKLGLANWLARNPLRQFARAVLRRNYGNDDECPEVAPDTTKPLKTEQVGALSTAISGSGIPVRADEFYKKIGFTQPDEGEVVLVRGELMIQEAAQTKEDKFNESLEQQAKTAEVQMELQGEQEQQHGVQAGERVRINVVKANTQMGHDFRGNQWTVGDLMAGLTRTPAVKSLHRDIEDNAYHTVRMNPHDAVSHLDEAIKTWTDSLGEVHKIKDGKSDISGRHLSDLRYREGESGRVITPNEWAERFGVPHHENQIEGYKKAKRSIEKLMSRHSARQKEKQKEDVDASDLTLRDALVHATDEELNELEAKLTAAESAPHKNGEVTAVEERVEQLTSRIKF